MLQKIFRPQEKATEGSCHKQLVRILAEGFRDPRGVGLRQHAGAAEVSLPLARDANLKMARAGTAMLHLARGRETETLLRALVGFLLRHGHGLLVLFGLCRRALLRCFWRERAGESAAGLLGRGFHFADVFELLDNQLHDPLAFFDVGHLTAAEDDRHDDFVFVKKESSSLGNLEFDVVIARLGTDSDFLDLRVMNVGFVMLLFLLVFELAEVHDPADRRLFVGRHLDKIEAGVSREREGIVCGDDAELAPVGADNSDRGDPNLVVDAMLLLYGSRLPAAE